MKNMKTCFYEFETGAKKPVKFFVFADLHITEKMDTEVLTSLHRRAKRNEPDAIIFLGDLVHTVQFLDKENNYKLLKNFLNAMAEIAPLYLIVGNHDMRSVAKRRGRAFMEELTGFWDDLMSNPKIKLLRDEVVETDKFILAGMEQGPDCYNLNREGGANALQRNILVSEKADVMERELKKFLDKVTIPKRSKKPKILLVHSARFLTERNLGGLVADFDVIMSGHLHNMAMPERAFRKMMSAWGLGLKNGHLVCPPVSTFANPRFQRHFTRCCAVVKIK